MRVFPLAVAATLLATGTMAMARSRGSTSWGKAGVSLRQFVRDANACSQTSRTVVVSIKPETLRQMDALSSAALLDIAMQSTGGPDYNPMQTVSNVTSQNGPEDIARRTNTFGEKYVASTLR